MNLPRPPAVSTMSGPGCRYRWYAFASTACAPRSDIDSGSTALTVALVPTAMNAGVWMSPCGVRRVPVRPSASGSRLVTENELDGSPRLSQHQDCRSRHLGVGTRPSGAANDALHSLGENLELVVAQLD